MVETKCDSLSRIIKSVENKQCRMKGNSWDISKSKVIQKYLHNVLTRNLLGLMQCLLLATRG